MEDRSDRKSKKPQRVAILSDYPFGSVVDGLRNSTPPPPLIDMAVDSGYVMRFREGGRVVIRDRRRFTPVGLFLSAVAGSHGLDGQPIRVGSFIPGISFRLSITRSPPAHVLDPCEFVFSLWRRIQWQFYAWLADDPDSPSLNVAAEDVGLSVEFARDHLRTLKPGVMQIDVVD